MTNDTDLLLFAKCTNIRLTFQSEWRAWEMDGAVPTSKFGTGPTPREAVVDLMRKVTSDES